MKYEGMQAVQGEIRKSPADAVYIRRKRYGESGEGSFFSKLYRQFFATMAALIPLTKNYLDDVKEAVKTDYIEDVLAVFNEN